MIKGKSELNRQIVFNLIATILVSGSNFLVLPLVARQLGPVQFSYYVSYCIIEGVLGFLELGLGMSANRAITAATAEGNDEDAGSIAACVLGFGYGLGTVFCLGVGLFLPTLFSLLFSLDGVLSSAPLAPLLFGVLLLLKWPSGLVANLVTGVGLNHRISISRIVNQGVFLSLLVWSTYYYKLTLETLIISSIMGVAAGTVVVWSTIEKSIHVRWSAMLQMVRWKDLWVNSRCSNILSIASFLILSGDRVFISRLGPEAYAHYQLALVTALALLQLVYPFSSVLFPRLTEAWVRNDHVGIRVLWARYVQPVQLMLLLAVSSLIWSVGYWAPKWTRDPNSADALAPLIGWLLVGGFCQALSCLENIFVLAAREPSYLSVAYGVGIAIHFLGCFVGVKLQSSHVIAVSWVISSATILILQVVFRRRLYRRLSTTHRTLDLA